MTKKEMKVQIALGILYSSLSIEELCIIARDCKTPIIALNYLSKDPYYYVRTGIASNLSTIKKTLTKLAKDPSHIVRSTVGSNPNTPEIVLNILSTDDHEYVRLYVRKFGNCKLTDEEFKMALKY